MSVPPPPGFGPPGPAVQAPPPAVYAPYPVAQVPYASYAAAYGYPPALRTPKGITALRKSVDAGVGFHLAAFVGGSAIVTGYGVPLPAASLNNATGVGILGSCACLLMGVVVLLYLLGAWDSLRLGKAEFGWERAAGVENAGKALIAAVGAVFALIVVFSAVLAGTSTGPSSFGLGVALAVILAIGSYARALARVFLLTGLAAPEWRERLRIYPFLAAATPVASFLALNGATNASITVPHPVAGIGAGVGSIFALQGLLLLRLAIRSAEGRMQRGEVTPSVPTAGGSWPQQGTMPFGQQQPWPMPGQQQSPSGSLPGQAPLAWFNSAVPPASGSTQGPPSGPPGGPPPAP